MADFQKQVNDVLEVVMFENWLRFYFIQQGADENDLKIVLPAKTRDRIAELYPGLNPLAEKLDGRAIDFETSRNSVIDHIMKELEGKSLPKGGAAKILQSSTFQTRLHLFHTWEQLHEDQLDNGFQEFGAWRSLFAQWLQTPGAQKLENQMMQKQGGF